MDVPPPAIITETNDTEKKNNTVVDCFNKDASERDTHEGDTHEGDEDTRPAQIITPRKGDNLNDYWEEINSESTLNDYWREFYTKLMAIKDIAELLAAFVVLDEYVKNKKLSKSPMGIIELIASEVTWSTCDLCNCLGISVPDVKALLKAFKYKWDKKNLVYRQTQQTVELVNKINKAISDKDVRNTKGLKFGR